MARRLASLQKNPKRNTDLFFLISVVFVCDLSRLSFVLLSYKAENVISRKACMAGLGLLDP